MAGVVYAPDGHHPLEWPAHAIILNTAIDPRNSNRSLKRYLVQRFNRIGIPVLIFDFPGVGDSEGELRENLRMEIYQQIEKGCFAGETIAAARFMHERFPAPRTIIYGNCGGAVTALHAAAQDRSITHLLLMSLPVALSIVEGGRPFDEHMAKVRFRDYLNRLRNPRNWRKIINSETNYSRIWAVITRCIASLLGYKRKAEDIVDGLNACFLSSFLAVKSRGTRVLCIFGGNDHDPILKYTKLFHQRYSPPGGEPAEHWETVYVPDSFHHCFTPESRDHLWAHITRFLGQGADPAMHPESAAAERPSPDAESPVPLILSVPETPSEISCARTISSLL